jgi:starch phosphorylase
LAACFIDSLATMDVSCIGYGIRYEYGIFPRSSSTAARSRRPTTGSSLGAPWEFPNPERAVQVDFGGHTETYVDDSGRERRRWVPGLERPGNPLQLHGPWLPQRRRQHAAVVERGGDRAFDLTIFNSGDYVEAVRAQTFAENISKVLYPEDSTPQGGVALQQQYFFVACSINDYLQRTLPKDFDLRGLPEQIIFQLNDTHPVIAIPS